MQGCIHEGLGWGQHPGAREVTSNCITHVGCFWHPQPTTTPTGGSLKKLILRFSAYQRASEVMLERKPCKSTWSWVETAQKINELFFPMFLFIKYLHMYYLPSRKLAKTPLKRRTCLPITIFWGGASYVSFREGNPRIWPPPGPTPHGQLWWIGFRETNSTPKITYKFWSAIGQPVFHGK